MASASDETVDPDVVLAAVIEAVADELPNRDAAVIDLRGADRHKDEQTA